MLTPDDDLLHDPGTDRLFTETNWFGFINVPEEELSFGVYVGFKPNLGLTYSWITAFSGHHMHHASLDYFDRRQYMPIPEVTKEGYELDNGLTVSIIEPLNVFRLEYADETRQFAFDVTWSAICPPESWVNSGHFDHFGKVQGTVSLRGKTHTVDTYAQRDHSWSVRDDERLPAVPPKPFAWVWGAFGDDSAFQAKANWSLTTPLDNNAEASPTPVRAGGGERASWSWNGTEVQYSEDIQFDIVEWEGLMRPRRVTMSFRTELGEQHSYTGDVVSAALIPNTFNASTLVCQVHWHAPDGTTGIGDFHLSITPANFHGAGA